MWLDIFFCFHNLNWLLHNCKIPSLFAVLNRIILAIGKNFAASAHVDPDIGFTYSGSFHCGTGGKNGFAFPDYQARIHLDDEHHVQMFMFNSAVKVCQI